MMRNKIEQARFNMVEQQVKPWNVHDRSVLDAMRAVRREDFVPTEHVKLAFVDTAIPLNDGAMLEPKIVARMLQSLSAQKSDRVLLVGVGTGYVAALLSQYVYSVVCVEPNQTKLETAQRNIAMAGIGNVQFQLGEADAGWAGAGEVDCIFVRSSLRSMPKALCQQLAQDGRCVAVIGSGEVMELVCYCRAGGEILAESILDTVTPRLGKHSMEREFIF